MKTHEAEKLIETIRGFIEPSAKDLVAPKLGPLPKGIVIDKKGQPPNPGNGTAPTFNPINDLTAAQLDDIYRQFKNRLLEEARMDPILAHILTTQPEIDVLVEARRVELDGSSLKGRIALLIAGGFLDTLKRAADINRELNRTGGDVHSSNLSKALAAMTQDGLVTAETDGYQKAPGLKVTKTAITTT